MVHFLAGREGADILVDDLGIVDEADLWIVEQADAGTDREEVDKEDLGTDEDEGLVVEEADDRGPGDWPRNKNSLMFWIYIFHLFPCVPSHLLIHKYVRPEKGKYTSISLFYCSN